MLALKDEITRRENLAALDSRLDDLSLQSFPDIKMNDVNGKSHSLLELEGNVIILSFWSIGQTEHKLFNQELASLYEKYHDKGLEVYQVSLDVDKPSWASTVRSASGNPYTPARNLYFISNRVIIQYDEFNSGQLNPYIRLDLSATYHLKSHGRYRHSVNLSLYNATAHSNETMGYIKVDEDEMSFKYHMACFIIPVMPSISYNCHF